MNREVLFKGKRIDNGEWVNGFYVNSLDFPFIDSKHFIVEFTGIESGEPLFDWHEVIPETVSQYIGIKDKVGAKIFDNSIMKGKFGSGIGGKSTKYKEFNFLISSDSNSSGIQFNLNMPKNYGRYRFCPYLTDCIVVGNLFDNKELLQSP